MRRDGGFLIQLKNRHENDEERARFWKIDENPKSTDGCLRRRAFSRPRVYARARVCLAVARRGATVAPRRFRRKRPSAVVQQKAKMCRTKRAVDDYARVLLSSFGRRARVPGMHCCHRVVFPQNTIAAGISPKAPRGPRQLVPAGRVSTLETKKKKKQEFVTAITFTILLLIPYAARVHNINVKPQNTLKHPKPSDFCAKKYKIVFLNGRNTPRAVVKNA